MGASPPFQGRGDTACSIDPDALIFGKFFRFSASGDDTSKGLKIVSYNVGRFALPQGVTFSSRKECADSIMAFLRAGDADIICLQEVYVQNKERVLSYLSRQMKGYDIQYYVNVNKYGSCGNVTFSRYPALSKGHIDFEHSSNMALYSDYCIGGDTLRVYNCHFESYNISLVPTRDGSGEGLQEGCEGYGGEDETVDRASAEAGGAGAERY